MQRICLFLLLSLGLLSSCEDFFYKAVDHKKLLGDQVPTLVVNSMLSPDQDSIYVEVTWMIFPLGQEYSYGDVPYEVAENALVTLSTGTRSITLPFQAENKRYQIHRRSFPIHEGETYMLEVVADGRTATASTTVPMSNTTLTGTTVVELVESDYYPNEFYEEFYADLVWTDRVGERNFYLTEAVHHNEYGDSDGFSVDYNGVCSVRDDLHRDGQVMKERFNLRSSKREQSTVTLRLHTVNEAFYNYRHTLCNNYADGPFAEPVQAYANISGGLGIFGAYSTFEMTIE